MLPRSWWGLGLVMAAVLGGVAAATPSSAQAPARIVRLGFLTPTSIPEREDIFRQELRRLGYTEGHNLAIEYRSANGRFDKLPGLAAELVGLKVDILVTVVTQASLAAKKTTATIPIVMIGVGDPVGAGLVASLARPGGNVTGTSSLAADTVGKQLELLREMLPGVSRVTVLWNPTNAVHQKRQTEEAKAAAGKLQVQLQFVEAGRSEDFDRAFATIARQRPEALFVLADPLFTPNFGRIAAFAIKHRLPTVGGPRENAAAGAPMTYGPSFNEAYQRAATYVDRILKGASPANLPVDQATKFELAINARTARAIGVTIPPSLVVRADHVVE
jgi:putative ABC transport system substrate-binding protein